MKIHLLVVWRILYASLQMSRSLLIWSIWVFFLFLTKTIQISIENKEVGMHFKIQIHTLVSVLSLQWALTGVSGSTWGTVALSCPWNQRCKTPRVELVEIEEESVTFLALLCHALSPPGIRKLKYLAPCQQYFSRSLKPSKVLHVLKLP